MLASGRYDSKRRAGYDLVTKSSWRTDETTGSEARYSHDWANDGGMRKNDVRVRLHGGDDAVTL